MTRERRGRALWHVLCAVATVAAQRPPTMTPLGAAILDRWRENASVASDDARGPLLQLMNDSIPYCAGLVCENATAEELLDVFLWEFVWGMGLIHNGPLFDKGPQFDDSACTDNFERGYIESIWRRVLNKQECFAPTWSDPPCDSGAWRAYTVENSRYYYPPFAGGVKVGPVAEEADSRLLYVASNAWKKSIGDEVFGDTVYVLSPNVLSRVVVAPYDTGHYAGRLPAMPVGVLIGGNGSQYTGVLQTLLEFGKFYSTFNDWHIGELFRWWYHEPGLPTPSLMTFPWFMLEPNVIGTVQLPENLLYQIARYGKIWGTPYASSLRDILHGFGRPLVWANNDTSGMIIDGSRRGVFGDPGDPRSSPVTEETERLFAELWKYNLSWDEFYDRVPKELRLTYPSYYGTRVVCPELYKRWDAQVIGLNGAGVCVYWTWKENDGPYPGSYCCMDGFCQPCANGDPMATCTDQCGGGGSSEWKWIPFLCVTLAVCLALSVAVGVCILCKRASVTAERSNLINSPPTPSSVRSRREESAASSPGSLGDLVGELHPGQWRLRIKDMNMDVRVYATPGAESSARNSPCPAVKQHPASKASSA
eukprot:TRINITY_DN9948_c0_g1_i1.p1 TRINITY_DN9948_c0_g1~~TRINITY_DN9948_c0_g1_i1.p1  ORF type:complete len:592 (+),score=71.28 TRINITY_DN9948_c0_g1_i1:85-1860(+)